MEIFYRNPDKDKNTISVEDDEFVIYCSMIDLGDMAIAIHGYSQLLKLTLEHADLRSDVDEDLYDRLYKKLAAIPIEEGWINRKYGI